MPKKEGIRELFDDIAVKYDRFNHISSLGADRSWRRKAVRAIADTDQPIQVLDVATGTADFATRGTGLDGGLVVGREHVVVVVAYYRNRPLRRHVEYWQRKVPGA